MSSVLTVLTIIIVGFVISKELIPRKLICLFNCFHKIPLVIYNLLAIELLLQFRSRNYLPKDNVTMKKTLEAFEGFDNIPFEAVASLANSNTRSRKSTLA